MYRYELRLGMRKWK